MQSANYVEQLQARFAAGNGKLFFVDGLKNRAFSSVKAVIANSGVKSSLCVVENAKTARQVCAALYPKSDAKIIESIDDFNTLYAAVDKDFKNVPQSAQKFKTLYPNVVIALRTKLDNSLLHASLGSKGGKAGEYPSGEQAPFTISDFLTAAEYPMLIVDNVYSMFRFEEAEDDEIKSKTPMQHERLDLMGKCYFTELAYSYKRLQRLVDSADQVILISNSVVGREIVSFYAAASLINGCFSYKAARAQALSKATDYVDEIERVFDSISYSQSDETIQSLCLQRAKKMARRVPSDIDKLGAYSQGNLSFMTKEEIFLRALSVVRENKPSLTNDAAISLLEDDQTLANVVCDIFFTDSLKSDIESKVEHAHIAKMTPEDASTFFEIFKKYAVYCPLGEIGDRLSIYRIYHDDSGFEDLIRRSCEGFDRAEHVFSASHAGSNRDYKCIATKALLDNATLRLPLLVVSRQNPTETSAELQKIVSCPVEVFDDAADRINEEGISVLDYDSFEAIACRLNAASVVFFDAMADFNLLDTFVKKAISFCPPQNKVSVCLIVTYDNLQGCLVDLWQERWLKADTSLFLPLQNDEIYIKGERAINYLDVAQKLDEVYRSFKKLVDGTEQITPKLFARKFSSTISDFTLGRAAHASEMEDDFGFLGKIAPYYSGIFSNSICVGNREREFFAERFLKQKRAQRKLTARTIESPKERRRYMKRLKRGDFFRLPDTSVVFLNVCSKQLHNTCDIRQKDCFTCTTLKTNLANRANVLEYSVSGYFTHGKQLLKKIQDHRIAKAGGGTITPQGEGVSELAELIMRLEASNEELKNSIKSLPRSETTPCYIEYTTLLAIKRAVQEIHFDVFIKYYEQLTALLSQATNEMIKSFDAVGKGAKNTLCAL